MSEHAFLAPSSAFRWVKCALAPSLEAAYPETEPSPASLEGTAAHWVVQQALAGAVVQEGAQAPNGVPVTREMLEAAELVSGHIRDTLGADWHAVLDVELRADARSIHPTHNWGTPDYTAWKDNTLYIWDFKFGHGIVEAFENWQMINYASGILDEIGVTGESDQSIVVEMTVIQPRAFHRDGTIRRWRCLASDLRGYFNQLRGAATRALCESPAATPTLEGCENCRGRHACEGLQRAAYLAAEKGAQFGALELSPHAMGLELRALRQARGLLDARVSGLEAQVEAAIRAGNLVPFWAMESVPGRLGWTRSADEVFALGSMLGLDLKKPPEPITPTQAKVAAKAAKLPGELFDAYSARPAGAAKLVPDDGTKARLIFNKE